MLIRKIMADLYAAGYPADAIVLNPLQIGPPSKSSCLPPPPARPCIRSTEAGQARLFGIPVIQALGMAADTFQVGRFSGPI